MNTAINGKGMGITRNRPSQQKQESTRLKTEQETKPNPPKSTAEDITVAFDKTAKAMEEGSRDQIAQYIRDGKNQRLTFFNKGAIEAAKNNPKYNVRENTDDTVTVIGVLDSSNTWIGIAPTAK